MKNTKQAIALASAAALSVGMLAGCGGAASSAATASSESNSTATAEASTTAASDGTLVLAIIIERAPQKNAGHAFLDEQEKSSHRGKKTLGVTKFSSQIRQKVQKATKV